MLIDVRSPVLYRDGTLPGAVNVAVRNISLLGKYPKNMKLVFFGTTDSDPNITTAVNYAFQLGFQELYTFGSKDNWEK